jgi:hypothetical protein
LTAGTDLLHKPYHTEDNDMTMTKKQAQMVYEQITPEEQVIMSSLITLSYVFSNMKKKLEMAQETIDRMNKEAKT